MRRPTNLYLASAALRCCCITVLTWATVGCAQPARLEAVTVLQQSQCQGLEAGLSLTTYSGVAGLRGNSLLSANGDADATGTDSGLEGQPLLVVISKGPQATAGYALALETAVLEGETAILSVRWETPAPDTLQAQVITHPCLVVALPRGPVRRVRAADQSGTPVGELEVPLP